MPCPDDASGLLQDHPDIAARPFVNTQGYSEKNRMTTLAHLNVGFIANLTHGNQWGRQGFASATPVKYEKQFLTIGYFSTRSPHLCLYYISTF